MKHRLAKNFMVVAFLFSIGSAFSQPFKAEINAFMKSDSLNMPAQGSILFVGSSSFTNWKDVKAYFPGFPIINRGFGGSSLPDVIYYAEQTILKYKPKQIYIYCGENDLAGNKTVTADTVLKRFKQLFSIIRKNLSKKTEVVFVSIKPSVSRWKLEDKFVETNNKIKKFIESNSHAKFVNVHTAMLQQDGNVMTDIFIKDNLHMIPKGYAIWQGIIAPTLMRD
jgi:lysophospholipase L1-like esterase